VDPNAPLTTQPFTQAIWALVIGFSAPLILFLLISWAWERHQNRKASREAQARLDADHRP
jgi:hypothetical protein